MAKWKHGPRIFERSLPKAISIQQCDDMAFIISEIPNYPLQELSF